MIAPLNVPADVREAFVKQTTEYIECYETHDARVWAESASEAAADLARAVDQYATSVLVADLERLAELIWQELGADNEADEDYVTGVADSILMIRNRVALVDPNWRPNR